MRNHNALADTSYHPDTVALVLAHVNDATSPLPHRFTAVDSTDGGDSERNGAWYVAAMMQDTRSGLWIAALVDEEDHEFLAFTSEQEAHAAFEDMWTGMDARIEAEYVAEPWED